MPTKSLTMPYHQEQILAIYLEEELLPLGDSKFS